MTLKKFCFALGFFCVSYGSVACEGEALKPLGNPHTLSLGTIYALSLDKPEKLPSKAHTGYLKGFALNYLYCPSRWGVLFQALHDIGHDSYQKDKTKVEIKDNFSWGAGLGYQAFQSFLLYEMVGLRSISKSMTREFKGENVSQVKRDISDEDRQRYTIDGDVFDEKIEKYRGTIRKSQRQISPFVALGFQWHLNERIFLDVSDRYTFQSNVYESSSAFRGTNHNHFIQVSLNVKF